jgi:hypothetical protein
MNSYKVKFIEKVTGDIANWEQDGKTVDTYHFQCTPKQVRRFCRETLTGLNYFGAKYVADVTVCA